MKRNIIIGLTLITLIIALITSIIFFNETYNEHQDTCDASQIVKDDNTTILPITCSTGKLMASVVRGYINLEGDIVLSNKDWRFTGLFDENNLAIVSTNHNSQLINKQGSKVMDNSEFLHIHYIGNNYYFLQDEDMNYLAKYDNNNIHIEIVDYNWVYDFSGGLAAVKTIDNKIGFINTNNELVIDPIYDHHQEGASRLNYLYNNDQVILYKEGKFGIINKTNVVLLPFEYDDLSFLGENRYITFELNGKVGLMDVNYKVLIEAKYAKIGEISGTGVVPVSLDSIHYAFLNVSTNNLVTDYSYYNIVDYKQVNSYHIFNHSLAITSLDNETYMLINEQFEPLLEAGVKGIKVINEHYVVLNIDGENYQILNIKNNEMIEITSLDIEVYPPFLLIASGIEVNIEGTTVFKLKDIDGNTLFSNVDIYNTMQIKTVNGQRFLQFNGEVDGRVFSSYLSPNLKIIWQPNTE